MLIREIETDDWAQVYSIFTAIVTAGETYAYPEGLCSDGARALWVEEPPGRTVVAVEGDSVLGTAKMGPNRPGRGAHIATASVMVDATANGRGVGRALGTHLIEWATGAGFRGVQFNAVVSTNAAAVHLWQALGFGIIGTVPEAFDHARHGLVGLHVMYRGLP